MKKSTTKEKKLSLKKLQMAKITNPRAIFAGSIQYINDCPNPDNGSIVIDAGSGVGNGGGK